MIPEIPQLTTAPLWALWEICGLQNVCGGLRAYKYTGSWMGHMFPYGCTCTYKNTTLTKINMLPHLNTYQLHFFCVNLEIMNFKSARRSRG